MREQLYRDATPPNEFSPRGAWVHDLVEMGLLVPVERCEHGNIDPHLIEIGEGVSELTGVYAGRCPGAGIGDTDLPE